jgi:hypothetical protein
MAVALCACGAGSGEGLDENGRPVTSTSGAGATPLAPTLASIQANVFTPNCAVIGCHGGSVVQQGLRLEEGFSAASLINVHSTQVASAGTVLIRVIPGNPSGSFLIQKLEGTQAVGDRMPAFSPPLPQSTIDVIRQWIQNGAAP